MRVAVHGSRQVHSDMLSGDALGVMDMPIPYVLRRAMAAFPQRLSSQDI